MQFSLKSLFLIAGIAALSIFAFSGRGTMPVAKAEAGFSTAVAAQSFNETGDMSRGTDYAAVANSTMRAGEGLKLFQRTTGCTTGCTVGCTNGCTVGCTVGCKP